MEQGLTNMDLSIAPLSRQPNGQRKPHPASSVNYRKLACIYKEKENTITPPQRLSTHRRRLALRHPMAGIPTTPSQPETIGHAPTATNRDGGTPSLPTTQNTTLNTTQCPAMLKCTDDYKVKALNTQPCALSVVNYPVAAQVDPDEMYGLIEASLNLNDPDCITVGERVYGGTLILIKNSIKHYCVPTPLQAIEATIDILATPDHNPSVSVYIPPKSDECFFTNSLKNVLQISSNCVVFGDFNSTLNAWNCKFK
ncbi:hypothetical protein TNCV_3413901 [Trichonephila clavipes]|uniref:Endonuclease/exonuclease/phosphatase domain-containing protein n=1 Tax=Trichonephila clavipes TaxID=2585209 RepID=A0A8X6RFG7_TRICX|nr:hypothetical protein TNCV_3413901 [Trichonephila clavipes]